MDPWPEPVERVARALRDASIDARVEELAHATPTAEDTAKALGCGKGQIVASLLFVCDGRPILTLVPGDRQVDPARVASAVGSRRARVGRPEEVRAATGCDPAVVAPFPAPGVFRVVLARELLVHEIVWVVAGTARHMAGLSPLDLVRLTRARADDLCA